MNDPLEIPEHIRDAAATVEIFFDANGINEWALMGIQSRRSEPEPTPSSDTPDMPEGFGRQIFAAERAQQREQCERATITGLEQQIATERAAREQAETRWKQYAEMHEDAEAACNANCQTIATLTTRAEQCEARLVDALDHIRWLQPMAKGWAHAHESIASNHRIVLAADAFIAQTTPPPILAELTRLRAVMKAADRFVPVAESRNDQLVRAESELAALKLKLEVAMKALRELTEPMGAFRKDPLEHARNIIENSIRVAEEALSQLNESEEKK